MKRVFFPLILAAIAVGTAAAEEDDGIMGLYFGNFGSMTGSVQVVALGNDHYKGSLIYLMPSEIPLEARVPLKGAKENGAVVLTGGKESNMATRLVIKDGALTGTTTYAEQELAVNMQRQIVEPETLGAEPPEGAIMLFDGQNLDAWERWPLKWNLVDGAMEVVGSNLVTKEKFGDCHLHLEFRTPFMPKERGQGRGNSGVYIMGRYEIQVLDSFGEEPAWDYCGGIYKQAVPSVNASLPPLTWQTYDIDFTAPRFNESGKKTQNARITVRHNGTVIHNNVELFSATPGGVSGQEAPQGRLLLQDHNDQVRYRNIWLVKK